MAKTTVTASNDNLSWNCGFEGETRIPAVVALRRRQAKNFIVILMISRGVPMLLAGDEIWRTQRGNNNAWCQDNELSWFDWSLVEIERDMLEFVRGMIALRRRHPSLTRNAFSPVTRYQDATFQISHGTGYG
jgi:Type II secretory pathway, pullulanase PulA and related glycosidases